MNQEINLDDPYRGKYYTPNELLSDVSAFLPFRDDTSRMIILKHHDDNASIRDGPLRYYGHLISLLQAPTGELRLLIATPGPFKTVHYERITIDLPRTRGVANLPIYFIGSHLHPVNAEEYQLHRGHYVEAIEKHLTACGYIANESSGWCDWRKM